MRLSKIKLAGFKSFVDATTIPLPSNLVGVVGPNGCGKSNVIDAVRWVMGESSAKNLRGDSMTDVIFNGSTSRKPVGQATVELVFDNSDGTIAGQYAGYNEISVKRLVSRDGQSNYYLNGVRCRRRDITDIFLGTGLGPRSYSIIEQGMISKLIEAKPEDLRSFLEEAAGISKYKERRRETENRIRHTRDNMDRLNDLRDELSKQLAHLERQSKTAEKYKTFKEEERLLKSQLLALRWLTLNEQVGTREQSIAELETSLEGEIAKQRSIESDTETFREGHVEATEIFNEVQGRYYGIGSDIARTEQAIQHAKERRQQQQYDLSQAEKAWRDAQAHLESDQHRIEELNMQRMENEPALEINQERELQSTEALAIAESAMHEWQQTWDEFNQRAAEPSQTAQVERTRVGHLEQTQAQLQQRIERYTEERGNLSTEGLEEELQELAGQSESLSMDESAREEQLQTHIQQINQQREQSSQLTATLDESRSRMQSIKGRKASLEALQQAALGKRGGAVTSWLNKQGLAENHRLAQELTVEGGWERAVECVLGFHLEAVCVDSIDPVTGLLEELQHGSLALLDKQGAAAAAEHQLTTPLLSKVESAWPINGLLNGVYAVEDLTDALQLRTQLKGSESIVTRDGIWLGQNWLRVARDADEKAGVLHREQELKELTAELEELEEKLEMLQQQFDVARESLRHHEQEREVCQQGLKEVSRQAADVQARISGRQVRLDQMRTRIERIETEQADLQRQFVESGEQAEVSRGNLHLALASMEELAIQREALSDKKESIRNNLEQCRQQAKQHRDEAYQLGLRIQSVTAALESTTQSMERMQQQLEQLAERKENLQVSLAESDAPIEQQAIELETLLNQRSEVEVQLSEARAKVEEIDFSLREFDGQRNSIEHRVQALRSEMDQFRMAWQELKVRRETVQEQLTEAGAELQKLFDEMPEEADENSWLQSVNAVEARIQRLGPINLAAIDEYKTQSERQVYLDAQLADLTAALDTLENAIRKIDRETRTRFKETYDKVNSGVQELFPRLFGGGHAYLELTGDDLLDTGVTIMARPPGKRNSTIHLLSGGEKALTAVALVFSIFQLNPAPFCMLDEVDAPLDEANVGRFSRMVKEMSEHVQFIFITHNKSTMEISEQLNGVTMHEPGVSRLVTVSVTEAAEMAGIE